MLFAEYTWQAFTQHTIDGLTFGALIALIALGYTMVYGIVELINFAHGDLFMLGAFLGLTVITYGGVSENSDTISKVSIILLSFLLCSLFCGLLNVLIDRSVYKPLRTAPKLAPLVSAIGVSFVLMNAGLFWGLLFSSAAAQDINFPKLVSDTNLLVNSNGEHMLGNGSDGKPSSISFSSKNLLIFGITIPLMFALTLFVKFSRLGKAMRATAQNPTAAKLMGINTDSVISVTFAIGGILAGASSLVFALYNNTINFQMGFQNGLYAFTAAVLGGIGRIPGAVLGGLIIGLIRYYGSALFGENWTSAAIFGILILILIFRPTGLLGSNMREKV